MGSGSVEVLSNLLIPECESNFNNWPYLNRKLEFSPIASSHMLFQENIITSNEALFFD